MAFKCYFCEDAFDDDEQNTIVIEARFTKTGRTSVNAELVITENVCEDCRDNNTFYCELTDESYSDSNYDSVIDEDGDTICEPITKVLGMTYDDNEEVWRYPKEGEEAKPVADKAEFVDFYWELRDGDRHGVLQKDGGGEQKMSEALEKTIYHRIEEAGADKGDPNVVNVYTRLELIERNLLPQDYVL